MYIVANRAFNTRQEAETYCNQCDFDYDMIIEENTEETNKIETKVIEVKETKKGRPSTGNNANELYKIIRRWKRDLLEYIKSNTDRTLIYNWYELIKKDWGIVIQE